MHRVTALHRYDARMVRSVRRGLIAAALISLLAAPAVQAQQYENETGDLDLEVTVTVTVALSGRGYVADSVVYVTITPIDGGEEIELGTIPTDDQGRFFGEIMLPDGLEPGTYRIAATGVTSQGATRVLSVHVGVGQELELAPVPEVSTTTSTRAVTATTRAERGDGLDPLQPIDSEPSESPAERQVLATVLTAGLVALSGVWWLLYRSAKR